MFDGNHVRSTTYFPGIFDSPRVKELGNFTGNAGLIGGFVTVEVNSTPAKLFPLKFSNAITIGPTLSTGIGTSISLSFV